MKDEKDAAKNQWKQRSFHSRMRTKYCKSVEAGKSMHSRWNLGFLVESEGRILLLLTHFIYHCYQLQYLTGTRRVKV